MEDNNSNRRSVLKAVGASATFAGLSGVVTASDVDTERVRDEGLPFPDASYIAIGDDVREAVGHNWWLLRMGRDRVDDLLRKSSLGSDEVTTYGDRVTTLRDTYAIEESAVTSTDVGQKHTYHLTDSDVDPLGREEEIEVAEVANAVIDGFRAEGDGRDDVSSNWFGDEHKILSKTAYDYNSVDIPSYYQDDLKNASPEPDQFGCKSCQVDWIPVDIPYALEQKMEEGLRGLGDDSEAKHPPFHFYATDIDLNVGPVSIDILEFGGAPSEASEMVDRANSRYGSSEAEALGWAAHYLQDMSVPLHAGAIVEQVNPYVNWDGSYGVNPRRDLHKAYEEFIGNNMENASGPVDYSFETDLLYSQSLSTPNVAEGCRDLADLSGQYATGILDGVMRGGKNDPSSWTDYGTDVFEVTHNCFDEAGRQIRTYLEHHY